MRPSSEASFTQWRQVIPDKNKEVTTLFLDYIRSRGKGPENKAFWTKNKDLTFTYWESGQVEESSPKVIIRPKGWTSRFNGPRTENDTGKSKAERTRKCNPVSWALRRREGGRSNQTSRVCPRFPASAKTLECVYMCACMCVNATEFEVKYRGFLSFFHS